MYYQESDLSTHYKHSIRSKIIIPSLQLSFANPWYLIAKEQKKNSKEILDYLSIA